MIYIVNSKYNIGDRANKLTLIDFVYVKGVRKGLFKCDCGNQKVMSIYRVLGKQDIKACGCLRGTQTTLVQDNLGKKFNKLLLIGDTGRKDNYHKTIAKFKCDCGAEIERVLSLVKSGKIKSCGCLSETNKKNNTFGLKHGKSNSRIYKIYKGILTRCYNKNAESYVNYGGRGIKVCDEWLNNFEYFYEWSKDNGYSKGLTIDRIDNNGDYEPSNCRWVTTEVQNNNKRTNRYITYKGKTQTLGQWSKELNIPRDTLSYRLDKGWDIEQILKGK